uniref:Geranylgeranyl transferase type-2 subunit alpha n=1 Tax=Parascaris univalens TaxID=6257 RepID=A0A915BXH0_PARUN
MHFVKKVPTTEEERAARKKLEMAKLRTYITIKDRVFDKRAKGELDEEMLQLTATLLAKNPDAYTFWNIRRATIEKLITKKSGEENEEVTMKRNEMLISAEFELSEQCIVENPKSYGAWFHRGWALSLMAKRNIDRELKMTEKALHMDGRNFHCWDYRRFVAKLASLTRQQELEFSDRLINANFSNYSAWHYRSFLLSRAHESFGSVLLDEETIARDLKKLANAFFTDPEDQSAWIYTEWLIAMDPYNGERSKTTTVMSLIFDESHSSAVLVLSDPVGVEEVKNIVSFPYDIQQTIRWTPISIYKKATYARVFCANSSTMLGTALLKSPAGLVLGEVEPEEGFVDAKAIYAAYEIDRPQPSKARNEALNTVIENCNALIEEISKEKTDRLNKWPLFTLTRCLMELDSTQYHDQILANLKRLADELDPQRREMYRDMMAQQRLNAHLRSVGEKGERLVDRIINSGNKGAHLTVKNLGLRSLKRLQPLAAFITIFDASENAFTDLCAFTIFPHLIYLTVDSNPIRSIAELCRLPKLEYLSVASTALCKVEDVLPVLETPSLKRFIYCETPLAEDDDQSLKLRRIMEEKGSQIMMAAFGILNRKRC